MRQFVILFFTVFLLAGSGCVSEPEIDKAKFSEVIRTVRDLHTALTSGKPCDLPDSLLQRLTSGIEAIQDRTTSQAERDLLAACSNLLTTYKDGVLLCKYRTNLAEFQFVPKGRTYVFQELDPLVRKYDLATESHVYLPTGLKWRSISGDSIKIIWERAEIQIKIIENTMDYY